MNYIDFINNLKTNTDLKETIISFNQEPVQKNNFISEIVELEKEELLINIIHYNKKFSTIELLSKTYKNSFNYNDYDFYSFVVINRKDIEGFNFRVILKEINKLTITKRTNILTNLITEYISYRDKDLLWLIVSIIDNNKDLLDKSIQSITLVEYICKINLKTLFIIIQKYISEKTLNKSKIVKEYIKLLELIKDNKEFEDLIFFMSDDKEDTKLKNIEIRFFNDDL